MLRAVLAPGLALSHSWPSCPAGSGLMPGTSTCAPCPAGTWSPPSSVNCSKCKPGRWSAQEGAGEEDVCEPCSRGKWSSQYGAVLEAACQDCPHGRWSGALAAGSFSDCQLCPAGRWSHTWGSTNGSVCALCPAGTYGPHQGQFQQNACHGCPAGRWRSESGGSSVENCSRCPVGTWSNVFGASDIGSCTSCPAGRWSDTEGADSHTFCRYCVQGRYSDLEGASAPCTSCPLGRWWDGPLGANSSNACKFCSLGRFQPAQAQVGISSCLPCAVGNYSDELGASACRYCSPGYFSSSVGSSTCQLCEAGTWSRQPGTVGKAMCVACGDDCSAGASVSISWRVVNLDCAALDQKQREDLSAAYAADLASTFGGVSPRYFRNLDGDEAEVSLMPSGRASCQASCVLILPDGTTLQSMARHVSLAQLRSLLYGSTLLSAGSPANELDIVDVAMMPMSFTSRPVDFSITSTSQFPATSTTTATNSTSSTRFMAMPAGPLTSNSSQEGALPGSDTSLDQQHRQTIGLLVFLSLAACLCCMELLHCAWKSSARTIIFRFWKAPNGMANGMESDVSDSEDASDEDAASKSS